ncbi:hypothetical protein, unknown function [Leishmania tarentolae]|uniref:Uncharacterized protein n=1 Tax=Leishmania tarentolae TaxID=5689 RepID=A0A640KG16_LEITA|nr:hypothetical protein, unknown function [Leishmania tarentolae]
MSAHITEEHGVLLPDTQLEHHEQQEQPRPEREPSSVSTEVHTDKTASLSPVAKRHRLEKQAPKEVTAAATCAISLDDDADLESAARASATVALQEDLASPVDLLACGTSGGVDVSCSTLCVDADVTGVSDETLAGSDRATDPACAEKCEVAPSTCNEETPNQAQYPKVMPHTESEDAPEQLLPTVGGNAEAPPVCLSTNEGTVASLPPAPAVTLTNFSGAEKSDGGVTARHCDTADDASAPHFHSERGVSISTETEPTGDTSTRTEIPFPNPEDGENGLLQPSRLSEAGTPPPSLSAVDKHPRATGKHLTFADEAASESSTARFSPA